MIGDIAARVGIAWLVCALLQLVLWLVAQRTRNAGIVDVGWAFGFSLVVGVYALFATSPPRAWLPIAIVAVVWSVRLSAHLVARGAITGPEDGRYAELRTRWSASRFFVFFQAQAALTAVLSLAFVAPFVVAPWDGGVLRTIGIAVALAGILGETVADAQLRRFKRDAPRSAVCDRGLWAYSRHPNYFFEWCFWIGLALYGMAFAPWGLIAIVPQAIILGSIWGVTGIPPTENQAIRSKGDAYRDYQERVSRFVPWPPKHARPLA